MSLSLKYGLLLMAIFGFVCSSAAEGPQKPRCTESLLGRLWPEEANDNPKFAAALEPYGFPEVCTHADSGYLWRARTVRLEQLRKDATPKPNSSQKHKSSGDGAKSTNQ